MALDIAEIDRRYHSLRNERSGWDTSWNELAELFLPCRYRSDSDTTSHKSPKINGRLISSRGVLAMRTLAAGMQGGMTSPVRPWFRLSFRDKEVEKNSAARMWLDEVTKRMQMVFHESNFYNAVHSLYSDLGTFGTGLMIEVADEDGVTFHVVRAGEYVLDVDGNNKIDTFFRRLSMTARQIVDRWGEKNVPDTVKEAAKARNGVGGATRFDVIHGVFPRTDIDTGAQIGAKSKPYVSVYWLPAASNNVGGKPCILSEGGFESFPAFAPRWDVNGSDVYGRSPAMDITPDCRMLQQMSATLRKMQNKIADPPVVADKSLRAFGVRMKPGEINYADLQQTHSAGAAVLPIQQPEPQALNFTMQGVREVEQIIHEGLYTDLFRMLVDEDRRNITATEVQAKMQEKMILIGPVVERLHKELLQPLVERTYELMLLWDVVPEPPEELGEGELDVDFESVLAQAQKMTATSAIDQGLAFTTQVAQVIPEALDNVDVDEMLKAYYERIGMPEACMRGERDVEALRQQRAQQQAAMQQQAEQQAAMQSVGDATAAAKNLGQTPLGADGQTALDAIIGGLGGL